MVERIRSRVSGGGNYFASPKDALQFIPTGCKVLDLALGGGWAEDRIANIVGDKSTGKTLLCIEAAANFIRKYPASTIYYRESEAAFDKPYAEALGMPLQNVDFGDPLDTVEDMFEDLKAIIEKAKQPTLYILDSLDALSDRAELARDMDEGTYGANKSKQMSQLFRRLTKALAGSHVTVIIVSQIRAKIGVSFGRATTRSGGKALDFYASQVVYLSHVETLHRTVSGVKLASGIRVKSKCDKNKVSLPFRTADFDIIFGYGIDDLNACLDWLESTKHLPDVDLSPGDSLKKFRAAMAKAPDDEFQRELADLHKAVVKRWYEMETTLLPTRKKYA